RSGRASRRRTSARTTPRRSASRKTACARSCTTPEDTRGMERDVRRTIDALWRIESARIVAAVARLVRDVGQAEDLAQDALVAALEHWPTRGLPDNPAAWLMTTARNKALDRLRQAALQRQRNQELGADADARGEHLTPDR